MKLADLFQEVVAQLLDERSSDLDALLVMYLLHTHQIRLRPGVVPDDAKYGDLLGSLTVAHAAELVGSRFSGDIGRNTEGFWLRQYAIRTPFEFHDDLPSIFRERTSVLRSKASDHPLVSELGPGDG
jgi:hypothetical protein